MSITLNADTSSGLVMTSDTSGEIKLQSAGADIVTVNSSGITMAAGKTIPAASLTGTLPAIDGSALTNLPAPDALSTATGSAPSYSARAWASFNGGTSPAAGTIQGSGNVSSVTDNATGQATINFATAMPNDDYAVVGMCTGYSNYNSTLMVMGSANGSGNQLPTTKTTSAIKVHFGHSNTVTNDHVGLLTIVIIG